MDDGTDEVKAYARKKGITSFYLAKTMLYRSEDVTDSTWNNSQVTEKSLEIFKKKFKKQSFVHTFPLNIQISKEKPPQTLA